MIGAQFHKISYKEGQGFAEGQVRGRDPHWAVRGRGTFPRPATVRTEACSRRL